MSFVASFLMAFITDPSAPIRIDCNNKEKDYTKMEPLNKGHIGIRSTVPCRTVEPLNKGHIGIRSTVPCSTVEPLNKGHIEIRSTVPWSISGTSK